MGRSIPAGPISQKSVRLDARRTEIHAIWLQRLGSAKVAWGKFIGSNEIEIRGHEQRLTGLRRQRLSQQRP